MANLQKTPCVSSANASPRRVRPSGLTWRAVQTIATRRSAPPFLGVVLRFIETRNPNAKRQSWSTYRAADAVSPSLIKQGLRDR